MKIIEQLEGLVSGVLNEVKTVISLIKLEARLAGLSVLPLLINVTMLLIILMTTWFSLMLLVGYFTLLVFENVVLAICTVLLLNLGVFILLLNYLKYNLKNMSFEKTRQYFSKNVEDEHDKLKKTADNQNFKDGKAIKTSAD